MARAGDTIENPLSGERITFQQTGTETNVESLRAELYGSNVGVTCVYAGPVDTALIRSARAVDPRKRELEAEMPAPSIS